MPQNNLNYKKILKNLFIASFIFINTFFVSCSDDTVTSTEPTVDIDTTDRYEWVEDTVLGVFIDDHYILDSNNVYFAADPNPVYYDGKTYQIINLQHPEFSSTRIAAYDKDNIFVGGGIPGTYMGDPILKKITNGSIVTYSIQSDSGGSIVDIFPVGSNQCWITTSERWHKYYFDNGFFTRYSLDSGVNSGTFFKNSNEELYVAPVKALHSSTFVHFVYKFVNNSFIKILSDTTYNTETELQPGTTRMKNYWMRKGKNSIWYFNANEQWEKVCNFNYIPGTIGGNSLNDLLCSTYSPYASIFTWYENKWKQENGCLIHYEDAQFVHIVTDSKFAMVTAQRLNGSNTAFFKGRLKGKR